MYNNQIQQGVEAAIKAEEQRKGKIALGITLVFFSPIIVFLLALMIL